MMRNFNLNNATTKCYFTDFNTDDVLWLDGFKDEIYGYEIPCAWVVEKGENGYLLCNGEHFRYLPMEDLKSGKVAASLWGKLSRKDMADFPPYSAA